MKNKLEGVAVLLVLLLSLLIIGLIVQYNMIEEDQKRVDISKFVSQQPAKSKESVNDYLDKMEHYEDKDVKTDPANANEANEVNVETTKIELKNDDIVNDISAAVDVAMDGE